MKLVIWDFLQNYFLLLKFLGKLFSGQTNSAVPRTGRQKLENFCLCPLVGPRPTSPGVHPNYSLRFTTNVDRSFPSQSWILWNTSFDLEDQQAITFHLSERCFYIQWIFEFVPRSRWEQNEVGHLNLSTKLFFTIRGSGKLTFRPNDFSSFPNWTPKVGKKLSVSARWSEAN